LPTGSASGHFDAGCAKCSVYGLGESSERFCDACRLLTMLLSLISAVAAAVPERKFLLVIQGL
jgi:hypothetical protein